jgi:UDP-N-acetylglucosamine 1-carboxyvinyltransferase
MIKYVITGGRKLEGKVALSGNKNSTFPCIAAALLTKEPVTLHNIPEIVDVAVLCQILEEIGISVTRTDHTLTIEAQTIKTTDLPSDLTSRLRGSILLAGALISRCGKVTFSHPGGDVIGKRAINLHLEGFEQLGYKVKVGDRSYTISKSRFFTHSDTQIFLELPTVTGTENLILAAVTKPGITIIRNAASEPHVSDLCLLLNAMGAQIKGAGSQTLVITGVDSLHGAEFTISSDMIEFGTFAVAAAITKGAIEIENLHNLDVEPIVWPMKKMGVKFEKKGENLKVSATKLHSISSLITNVWPGFPTDLMSVMIVLASQATGVSLMHDWVYESRMFFVDKLISMGAKMIIADPHRVLVYGPTKLVGRTQETPDIRAGMALVLAALVAKGESNINRAELIERGYEDVVQKLTNLGATIERLENRNRATDRSD